MNKLITKIDDADLIVEIKDYKTHLMICLFFNLKKAECDHEQKENDHLRFLIQEKINFTVENYYGEFKRYVKCKTATQANIIINKTKKILVQELILAKKILDERKKSLKDIRFES